MLIMLLLTLFLVLLILLLMLLTTEMGLAGKLQLVNVLKVFVESEEVQHLACLVLAQLAATGTHT